MSKPLISIIIPCYNSEKYLQSTLESVVKQNYPYLNIILINDGSTDKTIEIMHNFAQRDSRILIFEKENGGGYCSPVNYALSKIKGEYFMLLGSDDELINDSLASIFEEIGERRPDMIAFRVKNHLIDKEIFEDDGDTNFKKSFNFCGRYKDFSEQYRYESSFFGKRDTGKLFKTSLLEDLTYFGKYGIFSDDVFSLLFAHKCSSFYVSSTFGYLWNVRNGSLSRSGLDYLMYVDIIEIFNRYLSRLNMFYKDEICERDYELVINGIYKIRSLYNIAHFRNVKLYVSYAKNFKIFYRNTKHFYHYAVKYKIFRNFPLFSLLFRIIK